VIPKRGKPKSRNQADRKWDSEPISLVRGRPLSAHQTQTKRKGACESLAIEPDPGKRAVRKLQPGKTGVFSRRQTCRGKSQEPCSLDGRIAGNQNLEVLEPIDKVSLGEITSHRAVTTVNANVASKGLDPRAEPASVGRRQHGVPKSDRCGIPTSAG
jgi:hypothetical protein